MKKAVIIGIVFAAITIGIIFFIFLKIKDIKENQSLTQRLSPALLEQLRGKHISDFPYQPAPVQWDGKFLQVEYGAIFEDGLPPLNFTYNKKLNEKLNTARFFPGADIKGIVWVTTESETVGRYDNGGYASRPYFVLSYLDLAQKAILAQDTLWGGMPPQTTTNYSASGEDPKEEEVIKAILSRTQN